MPESKPVPRLVPVAVSDVQTCFLCAETEAKLELAVANYRRALARIHELKEQLGRAVNRESYHLDPREPHRRKV